MSSADPLETALGYLELGMFSDAWEVIEDLQPEKKTSEPVLVIRLRILTGLSQWDLGEEIARVLLSGGEESRQTVARFHHARARALWQSGEFNGARDQFRLAVGSGRVIRKTIPARLAISRARMAVFINMISTLFRGRLNPVSSSVSPSSF